MRDFLHRGGLFLPLALVFSKLLKTQWTIKDNPIDSLGLWLNFAQLFYFPILIIVLILAPQYFIACYAIITAAHLFPYAWFYNDKLYAFSAGFVSLGVMASQLYVGDRSSFAIPVFTGVCFFVLSGLLYVAFLAKQKQLRDQAEVKKA